MKIGVIQFPGSNCERETMLALKRVAVEPVEFLWNESPEKLTQFDGYIIVGGFSYEDRARAGVIAALDPVMSVIKQQSDQGKPVLGICNGAQILVEAGLVPGLEHHQLGMALTDNKRVQQGNVLGTGYYNAWVYMRLSDDYQLNAFTRYLEPHHILSVPVAHAEGRFVIPPALFMEMQGQGLSVFQYCDVLGNIIHEFPINPNGSMHNIAAVSNKRGNVMAMMPHPERTTAADAIFRSMRDSIVEGNTARVAPLHYMPRFPERKKYIPDPRTRGLVIDLLMTDNQALSVENALRHANIPVKIKRQTYWEILCDTDKTFEKITASGMLFNDRKEQILKSEAIKLPSSFSLLVMAKEDLLAQQKLQLFKHHTDIPGIQSIRHGALWHVLTDDVDLFSRAFNTHLFCNPYVHDYYDY